MRKLVPLKVPYEELQSFRRKLNKLHLDFLRWNWNYISASICKEIMDKNWNKGEELRGTNGWKTADYKDLMRRAIALDDMHILRPQRTTYVTAWQVGFFERVMKANRNTVLDDSARISTVGRSANKRAARKATGKETEVEVPIDAAMEPSEERTETATPSFLSSEQTRSVGSEDITQSKTSEEFAKELTLSEAILEQIVAQVGGTVGDITEIPEPPSPEKKVRSEAATKTSEERPKALEIAFADFLQDSVVSLLKYLDKKRKKYNVRRESRSYI
ncbi:hypothetical protein AXG93_3017s1000 [Marchantia polymorpha subsp. ruderalis]|uniref:Uncharacterized protein n=1 Tax=Marchantia polymorpha subsp. ruderalis TaxID=1480154 RepID=A0A176WIC2_MARPO|nr:hypothetical protein AXG93_3017s1000 [Marchantia polymorpha subsp. ruderalis]